MRLDREHAHALDAADPLQGWRERFVLPQDAEGRELVYLCGHSLGAQPTLAVDHVEEVMREWRSLGVEGFFAGRRPWLGYHERALPTLAALAGAQPHEVTVDEQPDRQPAPAARQLLPAGGRTHGAAAGATGVSVRSLRRGIAGALARPRPGA